MENSGVIYIAINKINGKQYIGQAVNFLSSGKKWGSLRRWQKHVSNANNHICECRLLENAILKYGHENFEVSDILICNVEMLNHYEEKFIELYDTLVPHGYNLMTGGGNGRKHSIETRTLMSETRTGKVHSEITKQRIGNAHKGKIVTDETKVLTGKSSKYRNMSDENRKVLKDALEILGLEDLPMYIVFSYKRNVEVITVRVPNMKQKQFGMKNMLLDKKIELAIEYKNSLNATVVGLSEEGLKV